MPKKELKKEKKTKPNKKVRKKVVVSRKELYDLERQMVSLLRTNHGGQLWHWSINVPLVDKRWDAVLAGSPELLPKLQTANKKLSVLSLGCGFCMYWPLMQEYGVREFTGVDLFDTRKADTGQSLLGTTQKLVDKFCSESQTKLVEGDVRDLDELLSKNGKKSKKKYDIINSVSVDYEKLGSTGIPKSLFDSVCEKYLKKNGLSVYVP